MSDALDHQMFHHYLGIGEDFIDAAKEESVSERRSLTGVQTLVAVGMGLFLVCSHRMILRVQAAVDEL